MGSGITLASETIKPSERRDTESKPARTLRQRVARWLLLIALAWGLLCVLIGLFQSRFLYFPSRSYGETPADRGLTFEDLTLTTRDGVAIAAWYMPHALARGSVIFLHGNAGNMAGRLDDVQLMHGMGVNVLLLDYRGFGRSDGRPDEQGTYEDAETAWRYLVETRGQSPEQIVLFGRSLGGAIAIELATRQAPAALIVESTFTSIVDIGRLHYWFLPVRFLVTYKYESVTKVGHITCPKLHFHGRDDWLIPLENGRKLFEAAAQPKTFVESPGGHGDAGIRYSPEYGQRLRAFLDEILGTP